MTTRTVPQLGLSLPDMMVGLSASLLVIAMTLSLAGFMREALQRLEQQQQIEQNAQVALRQLRRFIMHSGGASLLSSSTPSAGVALLSAPYTLAQPDGLLQSTSQHDSLSVGYWQSFEAMDCLGASNGKSALILNEFRISTKHELTCKDIQAKTSSGYQALIDNVQELRFRVAVASLDHQRLRWVAASQFNASFDQVLAVEICLRLIAPQGFHTPFNSAVDCQDQPVTADTPALASDIGRPLPQRYRQIVYLRHRVPLAS